jgi:hypothetical protein
LFDRLRRDEPAPTWIQTVVVAGVLAFFGFLTSASVRLLIVSSLPLGLRLEPITPSHEPDVDRDRLQRYTGDLHAHGFVPLGDFELAADGGRFEPGFARVFVHTGTGVWAEVSQVAIGGERLPMSCALATAYSGDWTFTTTDRGPDPIAFALRRPRHPWTLRPGLPFAPLLHDHLSTRARLQERGLSIERAPPSAALYRMYSQRSYQEILKTAARRSMATAVFDVVRASFSPRFEWRGEGEQ